MMVDISKIKRIVIQDSKGKAIDRFDLQEITVVNDRIAGEFLVLKKD